MGGERAAFIHGERKGAGSRQPQPPEPGPRPQGDPRRSYEHGRCGGGLGVSVTPFGGLYPACPEASVPPRPVVVEPLRPVLPKPSPAPLPLSTTWMLSARVFSGLHSLGGSCTTPAYRLPGESAVPFGTRVSGRNLTGYHCSDSAPRRAVSSSTVSRVSVRAVHVGVRLPLPVLPGPASGSRL